MMSEEARTPGGISYSYKPDHFGYSQSAPPTETTADLLGGAIARVERATRLAEQERDSWRAQYEGARREAIRLRQQLEGAEAKIDSVVYERRRLDEQIERIEGSIAELERKLERAEKARRLLQGGRKRSARKPRKRSAAP
jgi:septal ring factor EnvC (AmiA/AmiB activator)